jgi:hypothetical protein
MVMITSERTSQYFEPEAVGPVTQIDLSADTAQTGTIPTTIAESASFTTSLLAADGFKAITAGCTLTTAGTIAVQRFVDANGLIPQGAATSKALTANVAASVSVNDGNPFQTYTVTITNGSGSAAATLSSFTLLLNAD